MSKISKKGVCKTKLYFTLENKISISSLLFYEFKHRRRTTGGGFKIFFLFLKASDFYLGKTYDIFFVSLYKVSEEKVRPLNIKAYDIVETYH